MAAVSELTGRSENPLTPKWIKWIITGFKDPNQKDLPTSKVPFGISVPFVWSSWGSTPAASVRDQRGCGGNRGWRTPAITLGVIRQEIPWKIRGLDRCQWPMSMRRKRWLLWDLLVAIWRWLAGLGHLYRWTCFGEEPWINHRMKPCKDFHGPIVVAPCTHTHTHAFCGMRSKPEAKKTPQAARMSSYDRYDVKDPPGGQKLIYS